MRFLLRDVPSRRLNSFIQSELHFLNTEYQPSNSLKNALISSNQKGSFPLTSSSYDHIDVPLCQSLGIKVGNTPDVLSPSVAEVAVFLTLMVLRRVKEMIA